MNKKMKKSAWLDTNIILRFLLKDDPQLFQAVEPLFLQAEQGDLEIYISILSLSLNSFGLWKVTMNIRKKRLQK